MIISLTGFMGCGKSSVGRRLSALLCWSYADLDQVIEEKAGRSIPEIFASDGEAAFRQMELDTLKYLVSDPAAPMGGVVCDTPSEPQEPHNMILSLGGGTVMTSGCAEIVHEHTVCIYLKTSLEVLVGRLSSREESSGRPMLSTSDTDNLSHADALRTRITELMARRSATYEKTAHIIIDADGKSVERIADEILNIIR